MFDLKIINGMVYDGLGGAPQKQDIGINGDTIADIGDLSVAEARETIDAAGCAVTPGFIDTHTHSDTYLLLEPTSPSKIYQGITTEVCGNCGASGAPVTSFEHLPSDWADKIYPGIWSSTAEFRELLEKQGIGVNMVMLTGHNTLLRSFIGYENRPLTPDDLRLLKNCLSESLDAGSRGLSTGLVYVPGMYASADSIAELAKLVAEHDGIYTSHMRSEGDFLLQAIGETIAIGSLSGVRVQISHLKVSGRRNWHKLDAALEKITSARAAGLPVAADRYPYTAGGTDLDVVFPAWAAEGSREQVLARLRNPLLRERLRGELIDSRDLAEWRGIYVGSTVHPDNRRFRGRSLTEVAAELELPHPVDALLRLCENDRMTTGAFFESMSGENMRRILREDFVMIGSDASLRAVTGPLSNDYPHPRAYGAMPRFLRLVLDENLLPLPEAIRKMTSLPAEQFRLKERGILRRGYAADIAVFAPDELRDNADYSAPHAYASGMRFVLVNGRPVLADGKPTGSLSGKVL